MDAAGAGAGSRRQPHLVLGRKESMVFHLRFWMVLAICATLLAGCSGAKKVVTVPVSGTVKLKGQPLANARVVFHAPGQPRNPAGTTDALGQYKLTTMNPDDGAPVGAYTVTVVKVQAAPIAAPAPEKGQRPESAMMTPEYMKMMKGEGAKGPAPPGGAPEEAGGIPAKYTRPQDSDLKANVTKEGPNKFDFDLQ
jgi:hypothetical protein